MWKTDDDNHIQMFLKSLRPLFTWDCQNFRRSLPLMYSIK